MENTLEFNHADFEKLQSFFTNPCEYVQMTEKDKKLLSLYQNELEIDMENGPELVVPFSYYSTSEFDEEEEEEFDNTRYSIDSIDLERFPFGASYIDDDVYIHLNNEQPKRIINQAGTIFYLKKMEMFPYLLKPLDEINPIVYPRSYFCQEYSLIYFMRDAGMTLNHFLELDMKCDPIIISLMAHKIIDAVTAFHENRYIHTDIKPDNICIQFNAHAPETSEVSLIDCESCQSIDDDNHFNLYKIPTPGTFTFYPPEVFNLLPSYVQDFNSFMLFQELAFKLITGTISESKEKQMLCDNHINPEALPAPDFLYPLSPQTFMQHFFKEHQFGLFNVKTDLFALGCVLKQMLKFVKLAESSRPLVEKMQRLTDWTPENRII